MTAPGIAFAAALLFGMYLMGYLGHRYEAAAERILDRWWGFPTVMLGGCVLIIGGAIAVAEIVWRLT